MTLLHFYNNKTYASRKKKKVMAAKKTIYNGSESFSNCSTNDFESSSMDSDEDSYLSIRRINTTQNQQIKKIMRNPTRRPNLKITNRNALLARENRKRKKEMMETMQQELNDIHEENRRLRKSLKVRNMKISSLENERNYLKSVLANKTEIMSILKSLPKQPNSSSLNFVKTEVKEEKSSRAGSYTSSLEDNDYGSVLTDDPYLLQDNTNSFFTDYKSIGEDCWDSPFSDALITDFPQMSPKSEHNYCSINEESPTAGVCLHINGGQLSLEFCHRCHKNAQHGINQIVC